MRVVQKNEFDVDVSSWDIADSDWDEIKTEVYETAVYYGDSDTHIPYPGQLVIGIVPDNQLTSEELEDLQSEVLTVLDRWRLVYDTEDGMIVYH